MKKALVLSLAVILGLGVASFAQTLSGSWDTTITIQPGPPVLLGIDSELIVTYAVSGWSFSSDSLFDESGWLGQSFAVDGALGAFTLSSGLDFDTITVGFDQWTVSAGLSLAGVTFDALFVLTTLEAVQTPTNALHDTALILTGSGTAGTVDVSASLHLGSAYQVLSTSSPYYSTHNWYAFDAICDFDFNGVVIDVTFPFCCADITSEIAFNCSGFEYAEFMSSGIVIPNLPWVTLGIDLTFTTTAKTLVINPTFNFGVISCFTLYIGQIHSGPNAFPVTLGDIVIEGIGLTCDIGGVQFKGISWIDGTESHGGTSMPSALKVWVGDVLKTYWEMYQIATTDDGCCGPFNFSIGVYFDHGAQLFDVSLIKADMSIQVATQFTFSTGLLLDLSVSPSFAQWTIGFLVEW